MMEFIYLLPKLRVNSRLATRGEKGVVADNYYASEYF